MFHVVHGTSKPDLLRALPDKCTCVVHDHTHASYKRLAIWIGNEWQDQGDMYRLVIPCCEFGCPWPEVHIEKQCQGQYKPRVRDWPDTHPFDIQKIENPSNEIMELAKRCKWMWRRVHCVYDLLTGLSQACTRTALEIGMEDEDFVPDTRSCPEFLPRVLIHGPVPFDPKSVAECLLQRLESHTKSTLSTIENVVSLSNDTFLAKCEYDAPYVTKLPYGTRVCEWLETHVDESTHSRIRLRGSYIDKQISFRLETNDGRVFTNPHDVVDAWIGAKLNAMEDEMMSSQAQQHRVEIIRSIIVTSTFIDEDNKKRRKWLDESLEDKRVRITEEFGDEFVDSLSKIPLMSIGPDFAHDDSLPHPRPELCRRLKLYLGK